MTVISAPQFNLKGQWTFFLLVLFLMLTDGLEIQEEDCYCSGVTTQCTLTTNHYWATLRVKASPSEEFSLTDKEQNETLSIEYDPNTNEMIHRYPRGTGRAGLYYWSMPERMVGNRVSAYGGNLTVYQRFQFSGDAGVQDADVILVGEELSLQTQVVRDGIESEMEERNRVTLSEHGWLVVKDGVPTQATKADFIKVLSKLKAVLIRASVSLTMQETKLRKAMMDISVPQPTGGPPAQGIEECMCPPEFSGLSCEECAPGHVGHPDCQPLPDLNPPEDEQENQPPEEERGDRRDSPQPHRGGDPNQPQRGRNPNQPQRGRDPNQPQRGRNPNQPQRRRDPNQPQGGRYNPYSQPGGNNPYGHPNQYEDPRGRRQYDQQGGRSNYPQERPQSPENRGPYGPPRNEDPYVLAPGESPLEVNIKGPRVQTVQPGDTVRFDCSARPKIPMQDPLTYGWAKQNGLLPVGRSVDDGYGLLVITTVETDDSGTYICTVTAGSFVVEKSLELEVSGGDIMSGVHDITISPDYQQVLAGEGAVFQCQGVLGAPLEWSRSGDWPLGPRARQEGPRLVFSTVQVEDEGEYVCKERNGGLARTQLYVQERQGWGHTPTAVGPPVYSPQPPPCPSPTVTIEPREQMVPQGDTAKLECTSFPAGRIVWEKVGEDLNSPQLSVNGGELRVSNASVSDRGMYVCTVNTNCGSGRASSILEVDPRELPVVELYPGVQQTTIQGESVLFQCRYVAGIPSPTISWSREDGSPLPSNAELLAGGVLRINSVRISEAGQYRCIASNAAGTVQALASLQVIQYPAIILQPSGSITLDEGAPLTLTCTVTGGDPWPRISWRKVKETITQIGDSQPTFVIPSVRKDDEGTYSCIGSNSAGEVEERVQVNVRRRRDEIVPQPEDHRVGGQGRGEHVVHTRIGSNISFNCLTGGQVPPGARAVWNRDSNSRPLSERHGVHEGLLQITDVQSSDHGPYNCQLIDQTGVKLFELRVNLIVKGRIGHGGRRGGRHGPGRNRDRFNWSGMARPPHAPQIPTTTNPITRQPWQEQEEPPIPPVEVRINSPEVVARPGETVEFICSAVVRVRLQEPTTLHWVRENQDIPSNRGVDNGDGQLRISSVQVEDSGIYLCQAQIGSSIHSARASLSVSPADEDNLPIPPPTPFLLPPPTPMPIPQRSYTPQPYPPPRQPYPPPAKGYQPPGYPYQQPAKGYQPPSQNPQPFNQNNPQPPRYQQPNQNYPQSQRENDDRPPRQEYPQPRRQGYQEPTFSHQPEVGDVPDEDISNYPPVGPNGPAIDDPNTEYWDADEDEDETYYDDSEEDYLEYGRSPMAYSSEDHPLGAGRPRQYNPYRSGQWAGEHQDEWGGCQDREVQCGELEMCIPAGQVCDGEIDCTNRWDESETCLENNN